MNQKAIGTMLRSKAKYVEFGEKNTKYFANLEKQNYKTKHITKLICEDDREITEPSEILNLEKEFYSKLYESQKVDAENVEYFLNNPNIPKLSQFAMTFAVERFVK